MGSATQGWAERFPQGRDTGNRSASHYKRPGDQSMVDAVAAQRRAVLQQQNANNLNSTVGL